MSQTVHTVFTREMTAAGWDVTHYSGRFFWEGPAVRTADSLEFQQAIKDAPVPVQWDDLGRGNIIYPIATAHALYTDPKEYEDVE